jgi:hypothetical protein
MLNSGEKKVLGSNNPNPAMLPFASKDSYMCANSQITRGITSAPLTLSSCFNRFPNIQAVANALGVTLGGIWTGPGTSAKQSQLTNLGITNGIDLLLKDNSDECIQVASSGTLGKDWLGCLWGSPEASFSCICPDYGPKYEAYLKLRQNVATFWYTKKDTPVKRQEFLDAIQYGPKVEVTLPGDFAFKVGSVVYVNGTGTSKNPNVAPTSDINNKYWIVGVKHVITNSGTHESRLLLTQLATDSPY